MYKTIPLVLAGLFGSSLPALADVASVTAKLEARSHFDDRAGNYTDVDDPAIWIHPKDTARSLVVGTLKEGGLDVYDLDAKLVQHLPARSAPACSDSQKDCTDNAPGRLNNADVLYDFDLAGKRADIIVASDRGFDTLAVYQVVDRGHTILKDISAPGGALIFSDNQDEVNAGYTAYGLATYRQGESTYAIVSQNSTARVAILELEGNTDGLVDYRVGATLEFPHEFPLEDGNTWTPCTENDVDRPHFEGMVADPSHNALYLGQENVGIWRIALDAPEDDSRWKLFARAKEYGVAYQRTWDAAEEEYSCKLLADRAPGLGDKHLSVDIEGLTIYDAGDGEGYLLVSSQGDNSVAVYDRALGNPYLGSFRVDDGVVDAVNETDGMMVTNIALGDRFPSGLLVMQDGLNLPHVHDGTGEERESSNFKFVDWAPIAKQLNLKIDTTNRARKEK